MNSDADPVDRAISRFRDETRSRRRRIFGSLALLALSLVAGIVGLIYKSMGMHGGLAWLLLSVSGVLCAALIVSKAGHGEVKITAEIGDVRPLGALLERLDLSFGAERRVVASLLIALLQRIRESDADCFGRAQRVRLNEALGLPEFARDADLLIAILAAYERVGDEDSLLLIEALAALPGEPGAERRVRDAARFYRKGLRERVERLRTGAELLRASSASESGEMLLRAANESSQTPESELLRISANSNVSDL